jgi:RNA polymerase sigma-70 factor (sigma-E family)
MGEARTTFDHFVLARSRGLLHTAFLLTGDSGTAEDLLQAALAKAYVAWSRVEQVGDPEAYVKRIMTNTYVTWWRRRWRFEIPQERLPEPAASGDHADVFAEHDAVWTLVQSLPRRQRAVLVLRYWEDLSEAETATILACSRGTVKSQSAKAIAKLRQAIEATAQESSGGGTRVRT